MVLPSLSITGFEGFLLFPASVIVSTHVAVDSHTLCFLSLLPMTSLLHVSFQVSCCVDQTMFIESSVISSRASNLFLTAHLNLSFISLDFSL